MITLTKLFYSFLSILGKLRRYQGNILNVRRMNVKSLFKGIVQPFKRGVMGGIIR
jgi:hypothetical protein